MPANIKKQETNKSKKIIAGLKNLERGKWKKGQSGNPQGRKPNTFSGIASQLRADGYPPVTKEMVQEIYQLLLGLDEKKLREITENSESPMTLRIIGRRMLSGREDNTIERMFDRVYGKADMNMTVTPMTLADGLIQLHKVKQRDER